MSKEGILQPLSAVRDLGGTISKGTVNTMRIFAYCLTLPETVVGYEGVGGTHTGARGWSFPSTSDVLRQNQMNQITAITDSSLEFDDPL